METLFLMKTGSGSVSPPLSREAQHQLTYEERCRPLCRTADPHGLQWDTLASTDNYGQAPAQPQDRQQAMRLLSLPPK